MARSGLFLRACAMSSSKAGSPNASAHFASATVPDCENAAGGVGPFGFAMGSCAQPARTSDARRNALFAWSILGGVDIDVHLLSDEERAAHRAVE